MEIQNVMNQVVAGGAGAKESRVTAATGPSIVERSSAEIQPTSAQLQGAVDKINSSFQLSNTSLEFSIDIDSHRQVVKMVDQATGELIKQYPSKTAIAISNAIDQQLKVGVLLDKKA